MAARDGPLAPAGRIRAGAPRAPCNAGLSRSDVSEAALSSVVRPDGTWVEVFRRWLGVEPLVVETGVKTGRPGPLRRPEAGRCRPDRERCGGEGDVGGPACIVDFGTGTTFDALSARGEYLGGRSLRGSASPRKPFTRGPPSSRGSISFGLPSPSGGTPSTRCSRGSSSATSGSWRDGRAVSLRARPGDEGDRDGGLRRVDRPETPVLESSLRGSRSTAFGSSTP